MAPKKPKAGLSDYAKSAAKYKPAPRAKVAKEVPHEEMAGPDMPDVPARMSSPRRGKPGKMPGE